jgi:hypothetical protein
MTEKTGLFLEILRHFGFWVYENSLISLHFGLKD